VSSLKRPATEPTRTLIAIPVLALGLALLATVIYGPALWDVAGVRAVQAVGSWLRVPMQVISFLGSPEFFLLLVPLVFWCLDKALGVDLGILLLLSGFVNGIAKASFKYPRPFWSDPFLKLSGATSFSLPSGHAQGTATLFGYLIWYLSVGDNKDNRRTGWRWVAVALLVLLVVLVSLSRVFLGVHYPGDVIWGAAAGVALLALYIWFKPRAMGRLRGLRLGAHVLLAGASALAVVVLGLLALAIPVGNGPMFGGLYNAARSQTLVEIAGLAGMMVGLWIGLVLEARYVRFAVVGPFWQRALRYVLGLASLFIIWIGLQLILPAEPAALGLAVQVLRYAVAILWAIWAWPWLFVRIGLGVRERE
jgi:membrane-associated phospholipid phosphatase